MIPTVRLKKSLCETYCQVELQWANLILSGKGFTGISLQTGKGFTG